MRYPPSWLISNDDLRNLQVVRDRFLSRWSRKDTDIYDTTFEMNLVVTKSVHHSQWSRRREEVDMSRHHIAGGRAWQAKSHRCMRKTTYALGPRGMRSGVAPGSLRVRQKL